LFGQRSKEKINRGPVPARLLELRCRNMRIGYTQSAVRRDDVNVIGLQLLLGTDLQYRHACSGAYDARQLTLDVRVEVKYYDERGPGILGQTFEQRLQGLHSTRRGSDANNVKSVVDRLLGNFIDT